jgi:hypothetical protein
MLRQELSVTAPPSWNDRSGRRDDVAESFVVS